MPRNRGLVGIDRGLTAVFVRMNATSGHHLYLMYALKNACTLRIDFKLPLTGKTHLTI